MVIVPLMLIVGYSIGSPGGMSSYAVTAIMFSVLCLPLVVKYHHVTLVLTWNAAFTLGFLPGLPKLWYVVAFISLGITVLNVIVHKIKVQQYKPLTLALLAFLFLVFITGTLRGGIGMKAMGSTMYGGKSFVYIFIAIVGYFALSAIRIPKEKVLLYTQIFFLSSITVVFSTIVYLMGERFYFLFLFVPIDYAVGQAQADLVGGVQRYAGIGFSMMGIYFYMMVRYGIVGILNFGHLLRLVVLLVVVALSMFGGFRSTLLLYALTFGFSFVYEKLYKTRWMVILLLSGAVVLGMLYLGAEKLPESMQRSISFLPGIKIDLATQVDAQASVDWRLKIWEILLPQVKDYFWLGKGFSYNASDLLLADESFRRGFMQTEDYALITGDYHNGPLSIIIPLGIWGVLGFIWINYLGILMLWRQLKYGDPDLYILNQGILALFSMRIIFFWFFFGAVATDMAVFLGLLGFSVAVNGVPRKRPWVPEDDEEEDENEENTESEENKVFSGRSKGLFTNVMSDYLIESSGAEKSPEKASEQSEQPQK